MLILAAEMSHPDIDGLLKTKLRNTQVGLRLTGEPAVDDVQTPLISGIFGRTKILSTLDLSSGLRDTKEPGTCGGNARLFHVCDPACKSNPRGDRQGDAAGPQAQEKRKAVPHVLRDRNKENKGGFCINF
jgi:hypothetical protein